jgi:hypothetical protein
MFRRKIITIMGPLRENVKQEAYTLIYAYFLVSEG